MEQWLLTVLKEIKEEHIISRLERGLRDDLVRLLGRNTGIIKPVNHKKMHKLTNC